jgi:hypothetical protein
VVDRVAMMTKVVAARNNSPMMDINEKNRHRYGGFFIIKVR